MVHHVCCTLLVLGEDYYGRQIGVQNDSMNNSYGAAATMNQMMNQWAPVMGPLLADPTSMMMGAMQYQVESINIHISLILL
jgi:hypothetical protein